MKTLLLIDGHAMIHRAFHALPMTMTTKAGEPTGAIYGFFLMFHKVLGDFKPTHLAVAFDTPKPTFRKKLYKGYQAKRPPMDPTLKAQIPQIKTLLDAGGIQRIERSGFEADDVIGTLVEQNKKNFERVLILTGDRDLLQLTDTNVFLIAPKMGVTNFDLYTPYEVEKKYGVTPEHFPDYKALAGDSSDNYNTARGIGPKTTRMLLSDHPTIEDLLTNIDTIKNPRWRTILTENKDRIILFKKIATILRSLDIDTTEQQLEFNGYQDDLQESLKKFELFALSNKLFPTPSTTKKTEPSMKKKLIPEQINLF
ncbi:MAG: 5'-3' exonuclease H3TH domain-containing protein [Candidatus Roizmanbacteria bacterium]|nr:5'-3' exonuclease H3TH domain-containing protein [Candidatus Roizmanbacteria bacterium]